VVTCVAVDRRPHGGGRRCRRGGGRRCRRGGGHLQRGIDAEPRGRRLDAVELREQCLHAARIDTASLTA
jgi:hypothetical protein